MKKTKPKFIVMEGGEGSGKSSLLIALKEEFANISGSPEIVATREPGGSPYAELIRTAALKNPLAKEAPALTTLCLMFAARFDNVKNMIMPALEAGKPVIADRFDASSYAYNIFAQNNSGCEELFWQLRSRLQIVPDLYIFMDVDPKEGMRRAAHRNQSLLQGQQYDHFDDREIRFHQDVRKGYMKFFEKVPHIIIDANKPLEEVKKSFIAAVKKELGI